MKKKLLLIAFIAVFAFALCGCSTPQNSTQETSDTSDQVENVDKSELQNEYDSQLDYNKEDYPEDRYNDWVEALETAKQVLANENATQEEVDDAESSLRNTAYGLENATDREHPKKFDYDWYKSGTFHSRDGAWTVMACMITNEFKQDGDKYYIATVANDDATLSDVDVLILPSENGVEDEITTGDVITLLGTTSEMMKVSIEGNDLGYLPSINPVEITVAQ